MKTKRWLRNKEMSDPHWIQTKQQDFFNLKHAVERFAWGSAYLPESCRNAAWIIQCEMARMDEPMKAWKPEKPTWVMLKGL